MKGVKGFQRGVDNPSFRHGCASKRTGLSPEYVIWQSMIQRCADVHCGDYPRYGGRGIAVCTRWHQFENFLADMGERPDGLTLERVDNSLGYDPSNCEWATMKAQQRNRRTNRLETYKGEVKSNTEWCEIVGRSPRLVLQRVRRDGWSYAQALETPTGARTHRHG